MAPRIQPTYNTSDYGQDIFLPLVNTDASIQTITVDASATEITPSYDGDSIPIDDFPLVLQSNNTIPIFHEGDDTNFSFSFAFTPDMDAWIYKIGILIGAGLNVSAYTNGTVALTSVGISARERQTGRVLIPYFRLGQINSDLTAVGSTIGIFSTEYTEFLLVKSKSTIDISIEINATRTGTNTFQCGLIPSFPFFKTNIIKHFATSGIALHIHAPINHADVVFEHDPSRVIQ